MCVCVCVKGVTSTLTGRTERKRQTPHPPVPASTWWSLLGPLSPTMESTQRNTHIDTHESTVVFLLQSHVSSLLPSPVVRWWLGAWSGRGSERERERERG